MGGTYPCVAACYRARPSKQYLRGLYSLRERDWYVALAWRIDSNTDLSGIRKPAIPALTGRLSRLHSRHSGGASVHFLRSFQPSHHDPTGCPKPTDFTQEM
ncbi:unnamed protein product [Leuciscus chuanchicus]